MNFININYITNHSFNKQKSPNINNEFVKIVSEPNSMNPLCSQRNVVHELCEGVNESLLVICIRLSLDQCLHQLMIRVLKQTNENIQSGRALRNQFTVDVLRQDEIQQQLQERSERLVYESSLHLVSDHVTSQHLNEVTAQSI